MGRKRQEYNFVRDAVEKTGENERTIYRKLRRAKVLEHNKEWINIGPTASLIDIVSVGAIEKHTLEASNIYLELIKHINKNINDMKTTIKLFKHWHKEFKSYYPKRTQYEKPMQFAEGFKNDVITKYLPNYLSNEYSKDMNYWIEEKQQLDTHKLIISSKNLEVIEHIKEILESNL